MHKLVRRPANGDAFSASSAPNAAPPAVPHCVRRSARETACLRSIATILAGSCGRPCEIDGLQHTVTPQSRHSALVTQLARDHTRAQQPPCEQNFSVPAMRHEAGDLWRPLVEPLLRGKLLTRKQLANALNLKGSERHAMNEALTRGCRAGWCTRSKTGSGHWVYALREGTPASDTQTAL